VNSTIAISTPYWNFLGRVQIEIASSKSVECIAFNKLESGIALLKDFAANCPEALPARELESELRVFDSRKIFHTPSCRNYNCKNCTCEFRSREAAIAAGFRPCGTCNP